jgi:cardiolipin synthase
MTFDWSLIAVVAYTLSWLIFVGALFVVPRNRKPGAATAWLMLIFLLPYLGLLIFLLIGTPKLSRRRREQQRHMNEYIMERAQSVAQVPDLAPLFMPPLPPRYEPFVRLNTALGDLPACTGSTVELLPNYNGAIAAITEAVNGAHTFVHVNTTFWRWITPPNRSCGRSNTLCSAA